MDAEKTAAALEAVNNETVDLVMFTLAGFMVLDNSIN